MVKISSVAKLGGFLVALFGVVCIVGNILGDGLILHPLIALELIASGACFVAMGFADDARRNRENP